MSNTLAAKPLPDEDFDEDQVHVELEDDQDGEDPVEEAPTSPKPVKKKTLGEIASTAATAATVSSLGHNSSSFIDAEFSEIEKIDEAMRQLSASRRGRFNTLKEKTGIDKGTLGFIYKKVWQADPIDGKKRLEDIFNVGKEMFQMSFEFNQNVQAESPESAAKNIKKASKRK